MDFGKVSPQELSNVDFTLAPDPQFTLDTLKEGKKSGSLQAHVGCAKWGRTEWVGTIYPKGTKEANFLNEYVKHFDTIELNATFYKIYGEAVISKWYDKAASNPDFKFCPKISRGISHIRRLKNAEQETSEFLAGIHAFKDALGPVFLQLSDNFGPKNLGDLEDYLEDFPQDINLFVELRHKEWFADEEAKKAVFQMLKEHKIGSVITDASGRRDCVHMHLSTPKAFIRYVGNSLHPTDYSRIDEWVDRIKKWADEGLQELWFFMHQHDEKDSPQLCDYVVKRINEELKLDIRRPKFLDDQQSLF